MLKKTVVPARAKKMSEKIPLNVDSEANIPKVFACIPVYMAEDHIAKIIVRARKYVDGLFVCDDASTDSTFDIIESLGVIAIKHDTNLGYNATINTLYKNAIKSDADFILVFDGDNRYDTNDIPTLIDRVIKGDVDVVVGSRYLGESSQANRRVAGSLTIGGVTLTDPLSNFKVFTRKVLEKVELTSDPFDSPAFLSKAIANGFKVVEVPVQVKLAERIEPPAAEIADDISVLKDFIIAHPLLLFGVPSLLSIIIGLGVIVWASLQYLNTQFLSTNLMLIGLGGVSFSLILGMAAVLLWILPVRDKDKPA